MAEEKRILIVDDHYDTLRFLRTMLETADERFKVTSVLSGEEAGLELRQPYHLLITDVKLPGVDGIQVAQRARRLSPDMPVIVMTGFPKEIIRLEEAPFDVFRAFRKPLIAEEMLEAVYIAIFGEPPQPPEPETPAEADTHTAEVEELIIDSSVPAEVHKRLELLRNNTGAEELMLATLNGDISAESGILDISLPAIAATMAQNLRGSFALADQLGTAQGHQSIQYHNTDRFDLYTANVGEYHFITMFFDASKSRRGRIGTVWVFIQRAIKDLEPLLAHVKVRHETKIVEVSTEMPPPKPKVKPEPKKVRDDFARAAAITREDEAKPAEPEPAPAPAFYVPPPTVELEPLSEADMAKLAALDVGDDSEADDFWSTAAQSAESVEPLTSGLSFEEALRQGMLPQTLAEDSPLATLLEETDLAPGTDIPPALLAEADDVADMTLDLGPLDDGDDFDLSGMPGFDFDAGDDALQELGDEAETRTRPLSDDDMAKLANLEISDTAVSSEVEAFWNALMTGDTAQGTRPDGLTLEEALAQGIEIEEHLGKPAPAQPVQAELSDLAEMLGVDDDDPEALDADSFWDEVADDSTTDDMAGMTLEEAIRKGLIPSNFNLNDE
ncbi:MAG: response regulator [Anaerolineales bacterium]|nr:response regulator [Anaerolineales bacterium]